MTAMPVTERMTAEEFLARPYDPRERGAELIGGVIVVDNPLVKHQLVCSEMLHELDRGDALTSPRLPGFTVALDALFGE